jgi:hypothetical protein
LILSPQEVGGLKLGIDRVKLIYDSDPGGGLPIPEDIEVEELEEKAS